MNPKQQKIVQKVSDEVKQKFEKENTGHDWWHVLRVWNTAKRIGRIEKADMFVIELAALLHDIADWKFNNGDDTAGPKAARKILEKYSLPEGITDNVCGIISNMSFKGAGVKTEMKTIEGKVVQDSDRLDAIGAIGIARTFAYGGYAGRPIHIPGKKVKMHDSKKEYFFSESTSINHFHEKLLLLKDRMNTKTAKKIAEGRHRFLKEYLKKFLKEWEDGGR